MVMVMYLIPKFYLGLRRLFIISTTYFVVDTVWALIEPPVIVSNIKQSSEILKPNTDDNKIIIIDEVGILPELYQYTKIAYIGGGFGKGVHSTTEPLVYNNIVCYGPNIDILDEAKEMYKEKCGFIINNSSELINNIVLPQFQNGKGTDDGYKMRLEIEKNIKQYINEKGTSSKKIHTLINEYI